MQRDEILDRGELRDKVDGKVELAQCFAAMQVLDGGDVVEGKVDVLEPFHAMKVFDLGDEVILQKEDLEVSHVEIEMLDLGDLELVQGDLLELLQIAIVVLGTLQEQGAIDFAFIYKKKIKKKWGLVR